MMFDKVTRSVRVLSAAGVEKANSGHPGMPLGMSDVGVVLFKNFLKISNSNPDWINRDRFVLSAGHGSMLLYSLLHFNGFNISIEDIKAFRQLNSKTAGHPEVDNKLGIDITTGPLGQGFATGVGLALAETYLGETLGKDVIDHYTYGIVSDGDLMEGISFEAAELAGVWKLGKLIYLFDDNNISIDGNVDKVSVTNQKVKFESIGWHVLEIDGHKEHEIIQAIKTSQSITDKPSLIIAKSLIGKFSPNKENTSGVHGSPLGEKEMELFLENIKWEGDVFSHDEDVYKYFSIKRDEDNNAFKVWSENLKLRLENDKEFNDLWTEFISMKVEVEKDIGTDDIATRMSGSKLLKKIGGQNKFIIGGSADLAASTKQMVSDNFYSHLNRSGSSIEFGIREHAMGAIVNGVSLHSNLYGYGSTFLVFSDYMRPSIRLAALMRLNSSFVFTHDSIYLGEDGPTHQPIEHLMSLRLIPNVEVIRPSNSIEVVYSYRYLFSNNKTPKVLSLTRQNLKYLNLNIYYKKFLDGAYEIKEGTDATIFATGSEVALAIEISELFKNKSIKVVSAPILNKLTSKKAKELNSNRFTFTLELGRSVGWESYIGNVTKSFSIETFGASAPETDLKNKFKMNAMDIKKEIEEYLI